MKEDELFKQWEKEHNELLTKALGLFYNLKYKDPEAIRKILGNDFRSFEATVALSDKCDALLQEWMFEMKKETV